VTDVEDAHAVEGLLRPVERSEPRLGAAVRQIRVGSVESQVAGERRLNGLGAD
jgi:hypothetical protein